MNVFRNLADWRAWRAEQSGASVGFVPTMGALHDGHRSLFERSLADNDLTVTSLFVNPTQFDDPADLAAYPVQWDSDLALLELLGVDAVLMPTAGEMYPDGFGYRVSENELSRELCGAHRPGHFDGVLTVVMRLLNLVQADRAYFGEKDYQQLQLVQGMVEAFFMDVEIVACPTVREADGLALSSRNQRLDASLRQRAPALHRVIATASTAGEARERLQAEGFDVDYVEDWPGRRLVAARLGEVRLIDNVSLGDS